MQSSAEINIKIFECERNETWDAEVVENPESKVLYPDDIDYLNEKFSSKIKTFVANRAARFYFERQIRKKRLIIKNIVGKDNLQGLNSGVIFTCNHFNPADNYVVYKTILPVLKKHQYLFKVIKEGNYTSFKGLFGFFFRNCNTLPLSSNQTTLKKFIKSTEKLLTSGEKILIYPEQSMWPGYKKPRPLKGGAFNFAVKCSVPIVPIFICFEDSKFVDKHGNKIQEHTVFIGKPIYPKKELSFKDNQQNLMQENYLFWKQTYENFYKIPLVYEK